MTDEITLLPCPFCGGKATVQPKKDDRWGQLGCRNCQIWFYWYPEPRPIEKAISDWNRRYTEDDLK